MSGVAPRGGLASAEELAEAHRAESRPAPSSAGDYWSPQQPDPGAAFVEVGRPPRPPRSNSAARGPLRQMPHCSHRLGGRS